MSCNLVPARRVVATIAFAWLALAAPAEADLYGGGGSSKKDCLLVFDAAVNVPTARPKRIRCTDGDPSCDADALVNGVCVFPVAVCANSTFEPKCASDGLESSVVDHALDNGDPRFDPEFQALQSRIDNELDLPNATPDVCTAFTNLTVPVIGPLGNNNRCKRGKKNVRIDSESLPVAGKRTRDRDKLKMTCQAAPGTCSPTVFFDGTLDRIQRQVFNGSCATGGCHDSQSLQAGLTLEEGSSHGALVDVDPSNGVALGAGYKRVTTTGPTSGDPDTSFLFKKITGDLQPGMGDQMPFGGPKLSQQFQDIVELWILDGAPETGWSPGTDQ